MGIKFTLHSDRSCTVVYCDACGRRIEKVSHGAVLFNLHYPAPTSDEYWICHKRKKCWRKIRKVHNPSGSRELGMFLKDIIMGFEDLNVSGHSDQGLKNCIIVEKGNEAYIDVFEDFKGRSCNLSWYDGKEES